MLILVSETRKTQVNFDFGVRNNPNKNPLFNWVFTVVKDKAVVCRSVCTIYVQEDFCENFVFTA